jgi:hypothetical protein
MRYHHQQSKYFRQSKADSRRLRGERKQLQRTRRHDQQTTTAEKSGGGGGGILSRVVLIYVPTLIMAKYITLALRQVIVTQA